MKITKLIQHAVSEALADERSKLSAELHNSISNHLVAALININIIENKAKKNKCPVEKEIDYLKMIVKESVEILKSLEQRLKGDNSNL